MYAFFLNGAQDLTEQLFFRMQEEGLLPFAMHGHSNPCLQDWLELSEAEHTHLLCCHASTSSNIQAKDIRGMALISPWHGRVWRFEFTAFKEHFKEATSMSQAALAWVFTHVACDALMGLCPLSNRHAWKLAEKSGFQVLGTLPGACYVARRKNYEDAVMVLATRQGITLPKQNSKGHKKNHAYTSSRPTQTARPIIRTKSCVCSHTGTSMGAYSGFMLESSNLPGKASITLR